MSTTLLDVEAVRGRFAALDRGLAPSSTGPAARSAQTR